MILRLDLTATQQRLLVSVSRWLTGTFNLPTLQSSQASQVLFPATYPSETPHIAGEAATAITHRSCNHD
jgi:hypothetical protein